MTRGLSIAVIGSGISGLSAAWLLSQQHRVTLIERDVRAGGHSNTVTVPDLTGRREVAVDTGFIVYNTASYPNLIALFEHLGVPTHASDMSFAVSLDRGRYEYAGSSIATLFGQPATVFDPGHWRMLADTLRFFRESPALLEDTQCDQSLGEYLARNRYSDAFITRHILPMAAAIWSTPSADVMQFPVASFVRFFANHGLLQVTNRPQWRTVAGGSREYVRRVLSAMAGKVELGSPATSVARTSEGVIVQHAGGTRTFDACVVATHADDALALLADADADERRLLGAFRYEPNTAVLHRAPGFMPKRRRLWSSWNYLGAGSGKQRSLSVTYWMNRLQPLPQGSGDLFVTLNPDTTIEAHHALASIAYQHPMFDRAAMAAQRELWRLQGRRRTWFCGSYFGYGFHEDGIQSGLAAAEDIGGVRRPWTVAGESSRIYLRPAGSEPVRGRLAEAAE